jgi:hypothetical protein
VCVTMTVATSHPLVLLQQFTTSLDQQEAGQEGSDPKTSEKRCHPLWTSPRSDDRLSKVSLRRKERDHRLTRRTSVSNPHRYPLYRHPCLAQQSCRRHRPRLHLTRAAARTRGAGRPRTRRSTAFRKLRRNASREGHSRRNRRLGVRSPALTKGQTQTTSSKR